MSPLVALLLFGFMFVIALSLTLWAALTLNDDARNEEDEAASVSYVPLGSSPPVWRREEQRRAEYRRDEPGREGRGRGEPRSGAAREGGSFTSAARGAERGTDHVADRGGDHVADHVADRGPERGAARGAERRTVVAAKVPQAVPPAPRKAKVGNQSGLKSNDEVRGARATVTQRPNHDDAFERFLENDRDERRR